MVDRLAGTLEETVRIMAQEKGEEERSLEALEHLEDRAVAMRMAQSKLDDVVRTLNAGQRKDLAEYAATRLQRVREILK